MEINHNKLITVSRNCEATIIPAGEEIVLIEGTHVRIVQFLGDNFTVLVNGNLVKVLGKDADAFGLEKEVKKTNNIISRLATKNDIWDAMKQCFDPEIPVNIVDLGLIYDLNVSGPKTKQKIEVKMTLTAPGCGMGPSIAQDVENKVLSLKGVSNVNVELVWDPQWDKSMMSEDAKLELGMF